MVSELIGREYRSEADRKLVLRLSRSAEGVLTVLSCEILGPSFTNRTVFHQSAGIYDVLTEGLAGAIGAQLRDLDPNRQLRAIPEFLFELPGLVLSSVHIVVSKLMDGAQNIIFRFMNFLGSLDVALRPNLSLGNAVAERAEQATTEAISDVALPLLNLCHHAKDFGSAFDENEAAAHKLLMERAAEIEFHVELVKRYVAQGRANLEEPVPINQQAFKAVS